MKNCVKLIQSQLDAKAMRGQKKLQYKPTAIHQLSQKSYAASNKQLYKLSNPDSKNTQK